MRMVNSVLGGGSLCALVLLVVHGAVASDVQTTRKPSDDVHCDALLGPFTAVVGAPCASPVGLCMHGKLEGDLGGQYDFTFETLVPAHDPEDRHKFFYTGTSLVTGNEGTLSTHDTGVIHMLPSDEPSPFVTTATVVGATGRYERRRGELVVTGHLTFGNATGSYATELCIAKKK